MDWWIVILVLGELLILGWLVHIGSNYVTRRNKLRSEERLQLFQRFTTAEELSDFLATEQGRFLLEKMSAKPNGPWKWVLAGTGIGFVAALAGTGLLASYFMLYDPEEGLLIGGMVSLCGGLGFLLASAVSLRLARHWGLHPSQLTEPSDG